MQLSSRAHSSAVAARERQRPMLRAVHVLAYVAAYVGLDWVSYIQPFGAFSITPWNPPPGLSVAFLLRHGARHGGWLFVAALAAELLVRGLPAPAWLALPAAAIPAATYTLAAWAIERSGGAAFASLRGMARFLAIVLVAAGGTALLLAALFRLAGLLHGPLAEAVAQSWLGDFVGIAVTTPALLLLREQRPLRAHWGAWMAQALAIAAAFWLVFGSGVTDPSRLFYVLFLPLVWIAMREGIAGIALAVVVIQVGLVLVLRNVPGALIDFQFLMLALCVTGLLLGAAVTERRRIEAALADKQYALDRSLRLAAASELASALAHELQQPLTALRNYLRAASILAARAEAGDAEWRATLDKALAESERAGDVVRRLRDFFRSGMISRERIDPRALAFDALAALRERAARHAIALSLDVPAAALPTVMADRIHIEGVLANLLGNAIDALKDMPGERRIRLRVEPADGGVAFAVEDNGPGVPAETAGRLFEPFATTKPHGLGLGLAISRSIVEAHGGRIWHHAIPGGTAFRFTVPAS